MTQDGLPEWAKNTLRPECPACGGYLLPCTKTATGVHPGDEYVDEDVQRGDR